MNMALVLVSELACPQCGHRKTERMPVHRHQHTYHCDACHTQVRPEPGDCCIYCSYGSVPCPSCQQDWRLCG